MAVSNIPKPQILFLDAYDSFTNNIVSLLTTLLDADVHVLPIDTSLLGRELPSFQDDLQRELSKYHAVVCGPGPGSPEVDKDVGLMTCIWDLQNAHLLPVLGICLGFQSLVRSSGGKIRRLRRGLHGMVRDIEHQKPQTSCPGDIFTGVSPFKATLYHSLCADIGQDKLSEDDWESSKWTTRPETPDIIPLAWADEIREDGHERILMAMRHRVKPFWGLQYHPESVCTHIEGHAVIRNWFQEAMRWNVLMKRAITAEGPFLARNATKPSLLSETRFHQHHLNRDLASEAEVSGTECYASWDSIGLDCSFSFKTIPLPINVKVPDILEAINGIDGEQIILDSSNSSSLAKGAADVRGRYSIIALGVEDALRLEHHVGDRFAVARLPFAQGLPADHTETIQFEQNTNIWHLLSDFLDKRRITPENDLDTPFKGGLMGFVTYEMGLNGIDVEFSGDRGHRRPDICFAWITKSIVIDHVNGLLHVQHLRKKKSKLDPWINATVTQLQTSHVWQHDCSPEPRLGFIHHAVQPLNPSSLSSKLNGTAFSAATIQVPDADEYEAKVMNCQEYIAAGESYELCLTDQTVITLPRLPSRPPLNETKGNGHILQQQSSRQSMPWQLYKTLRSRQPAPFGSFIRLGGATLISSSPERFLEYNVDGLCSMRPMKGTVRKSESVTTLAQAEKILHVPKEEAENLMIVDLVRHDLHGVCGSGNVVVPHLMKVEEYASVFQMITVVNGQLPDRQPDNQAGRYTGLDVLAASLPPGSMTGAPKKRSCEILQEIEQHKERSLYSGVVGYMDVTGRGDWSVTIRSMFRWDDEAAPPGKGETEPRDVWHIGAGGAVTILSTAEGESEEMFTKLAGPLGVFVDRRAA